MGTIRRKFLLVSLQLFDVTLMLGCSLLAAFVVMRQEGQLSFAQFLAMRFSLLNLVLFLVILSVWHITFSAFGLYRSRRLKKRAAEYGDIAKAILSITLVMGVIGVVFRVRLVFSQFLPVFFVSSLGGLIFSRLYLRSLLASVRIRGRNLRFILIVGSNPRAIQFADRIAHQPELGYRVIGFVDQEWHGLQNFSKTGHPLICDFAGLAPFIRTNVVDEVMIALPLASLHTVGAQIAALCEEQGITIRLLPDIFDLKLARPTTTTEDLEGAPLITHPGGFTEEWPLLVKRLVDIVGSLALLIACMPVMLLCALLIKLTSPGPVFFAQKRIGLNKRVFEIYKFRTMVPDAERKLRELEHLNEVSGPVFKIKKDPRITPIGKILRKTSIDELPQLWNVLRGEMSLVGPRPLPVRDYEGFSQDWHRRRLSVRPGITCLWQINGRSSLSFEKWIQLDLQYIDSWSLWLDLRILARTVPAVFKGSGAA